MNDTPSARIADELRRDILSGRLAPGARLPTERQLAVRFGISSTTVNKIMTLLEREGLLERARGLGTYVRPDLGRRALAVVLGPPDAPPGAAFWADLLRHTVAWGAKREGGVRTYLDLAASPAADTPLDADARAGRLAGALLLGAPGAAGVLEELAVPCVHVAGDGPAPAVRIDWGDAAAGAAASRLDPVEVVQAAFELLAALERAAREGRTLPPAEHVRTVRPRRSGDG